MSIVNVPQGATNDIALLIVTFSSINADLLIFIILTFFVNGRHIHIDVMCFLNNAFEQRSRLISVLTCTDGAGKNKEHARGFHEGRVSNVSRP